MIKLYALKDNKQIQVIEYLDLEYGISQMRELYPDCTILQEDAAIQILNQEALLNKVTNEV